MDVHSLNSEAFECKITPKICNFTPRKDQDVLSQVNWEWRALYLFSCIFLMPWSFIVFHVFPNLLWWRCSYAMGIYQWQRFFFLMFRSMLMSIPWTARHLNAVALPRHTISLQARTKMCFLRYNDNGFHFSFLLSFQKFFALKEGLWLF